MEAVSRSDMHDWLRRLREMADAATPGPWFVSAIEGRGTSQASYVSREPEKGKRWPAPDDVVAITSLRLPTLASNEQHDGNSAFIVTSRTAVPRLCDELERALERNDKLREIVACVVEMAIPVDAGTARVNVPAEVLDRARRVLTELNVR
jgi:hypothetical protein